MPSSGGAGNTAAGSSGPPNSQTSPGPASAVACSRVEDGSALPLSYAVLVVLASSFSLREYAIAVLAAQLVSILLRTTERSRTWRVAIFVERIAVAAATYAAYQGAWHLVGRREHVAPVLGALAAAPLPPLPGALSAGQVVRLGAS